MKARLARVLTGAALLTVVGVPLAAQAAIKYNPVRW